ncbi:MAG: hypothetical protein CSA50_03100 [Gammaproteobacteria bacterium]|nr:MAG: hypothetical protein CSA50_03100 [Gammaproteobacteria bacterium]
MRLAKAVSILVGRAFWQSDTEVTTAVNTSRQTANNHVSGDVSCEGNDLHHPFTVLALFLAFLVLISLLEYAD